MPIRKVASTNTSSTDKIVEKENINLKKEIYLLNSKMDKMVVNVEHMKNTMDDFHTKLIYALKPSLSNPPPLAPKREPSPQPPPLPVAPTPPEVPRIEPVYAKQKPLSLYQF